jgi:hypothetical protein
VGLGIQRWPNALGRKGNPMLDILDLTRMARIGTSSSMLEQDKHLGKYAPCRTWIRANEPAKALQCKAPASLSSIRHMRGRAKNAFSWLSQGGLPWLISQNLRTRQNTTKHDPARLLRVVKYIYPDGHWRAISTSGIAGGRNEQIKDHVRT